MSRRDGFDLTLAAVLLIASLADWRSGALAGTYPGARWEHLPFIVATSVPLVFRRRWPLLTLITFGVVQTVWIDLLFPLDVQPPLMPFVQLLIVVYSAAAYCDGREALAAAAVFALGVASDLPLLLLGKPLGLVASPNIALLIAFLVGMAFARMRRRSERQSEELAKAEARRRAAAVEAVEAERARIARELHDVISHDVSLMVLQASVERRSQAIDETTEQTLASIESTGREALAELRRLLGVLRRDDEAAPLRPQPGLTDLPELVEQARTAGLPIDLTVVGTPLQVTPGLDMAAYRIVQESLTNAAKHAPGAPVAVTVTYGVASVDLEVANAAAASVAAPAVPGGGRGLIGMRERVTLLGGRIEAAPLEAGGFRVRASLPVAS